MCQNVADEVRLTRPSAIAAATDTNGRNFFALAKRALESLARRHTWQVVRREGSFTTVGSGDQGLLTSIASDIDLSRFTQDAMVNRTTRWMVGGPMMGPAWQRMQAIPTGIFPRFTIYNGHLYMQPAPASGQSVYFEYPTKNWALSGGTVAKPTFTVDTDQYLFDDALMEKGLKWRMKAELGQPYEEAFNDYERSVFAMFAQDAGGKRMIDAGAGVPNDYPSALVPETWPGVS